MLVRTLRTRVIAVVVVTALVGTTLLGALAVFRPRSTVSIPAQGPWTVAVAGDMATVLECRDDPAVADDYMSADLPSTRFALVLDVDARQGDVQRVVRCIARTIDPGRISVTTTQVQQPAA